MPYCIYCTRQHPLYKVNGHYMHEVWTGLKQPRMRIEHCKNPPKPRPEPLVTSAEILEEKE